MKRLRSISAIVVCIMLLSLCAPCITVSAEATATPVIDVSENMFIDGTAASCPDYSDKLSSLTAADSFTVLVHFMQTGGTGGQSLFSISDKDNTGEHFHVYVNGSTVGYEFRSVSSGWSYGNRAENVLDPHGENTVAFIADATTKSYYLYANGELVLTESKGDSYKKLSDITPKVDTVMAGMTNRGSMHPYPYVGNIYDIEVYAEVLGTEVISAYDTANNGTETVISIDSPIYFDGTKEKTMDISNRLNALTSSDGFSVLCQFAQTGSGGQSLFSVSRALWGGNHFHLYVNGSTVGYEFRYNDGVDNIRGSKAEVACKNGVNSLAFVADPVTKCFYLYLNGELIDTQSLGDSYKKLSDIELLDTVKLGMTDRKDTPEFSEYVYEGYIADLDVYNRAISAEEAIAYTSETSRVKAVGPAQPFEYDDFGIQSFRIPCLLTLNNGDIMAVADLRSYAGDSPNNIDIGVRVLDTETGEWGEPIISHHFDDYQYNVQSWWSASFIDAAIAQTESGRIFMLVNACPAYAGGGIGGLFNGMVTVGGKDYYALTMGDSTLDTGYDYYMYPNESSEHNYDRYLVKKVSDSSNTEYTLDGYFNVYKNGEALTVKQRTVTRDSSGENITDPKVITDVDVQMNIFYDASLLKLYRMTYFYLNYSDDNGKTWSEPMLVGSEYREAGEKVSNKCPGVGTVVKSGEYAGRIIFPIYRGETFEEMTVSCLYSDDNGKTWQMGENISRGSCGAKIATEAQIAEMPDGSLRIYARSNLRYVLYADSIDGGKTWSEFKKDDDLYYCSDCFISVLRYPTKIDGKDAILISYPEGGEPNGRFNGVIKIGLINENEGYDAPDHDRYSIEWKYTYSVAESFWYSCLAPTEDGVAVLYDYSTYDNHINSIRYEEISLDDIKGLEGTVDSFEIESVDGNEITVALRLKDKVFSRLSELEEATAVIKTIDDNVVLSYYGTSEDGKTVYFKGTLPDGVISMVAELEYSETNNIFTLAGAVSPASVSNVSYVYSKGIDSVEINGRGELVISYTDGTSQNLGIVKGEDGSDGKDGITPKLRINETTNEWEVSYDSGVTWESLGVKATGAQGPQGEKGDTGATGAQGPQGEKGDTGSDGKDGVDGEDGANGKDGADGSNGLVVAATAIGATALAGNIALIAVLFFKRKKLF